jgi:hypothetical protein
MFPVRGHVASVNLYFTASFCLVMVLLLYKHQGGAALKKAAILSFFMHL